jgi:hypothetical protein
MEWPHLRLGPLAVGPYTSPSRLHGPKKPLRLVGSQGCRRTPALGSGKEASADGKRQATDERRSWAKPAFGKMRRKEFEKALAKLQVELTIACALIDASH